MFNQFGSKFRHQISQFLHSLAEKLDENAYPPGEKKNYSEQASPLPLQKTLSGKQPRRGIKLRVPTKLKAFSQTAIASFKKVSTVRRRPRFWLFLAIGVGATGSAIALGVSLYQLESSITESVEDALIYSRPDTLIIKGSDGEVLREIGPVTHEKTKIWQVPDPVIQAFIASEDRRFQTHKGVDPLGIFRAIFSNIQAGEVVEGGSTITQQLARIVFLNQDRNLGRKIKEIRLAQKIESDLTKEEILERYLNLVYLGSGAYGIADAAWVYFSKPLAQLTVGEAATLAGIVPAPSVYSPLQNKAAATERRNMVLGRMKDEGFISDQELEKAIATPLVLKPGQLKRLERQAPYFTDYIQKELPKYVSEDTLKAGGVVVETTLNTQWQKAAEAAIDKAVNEYGRWQGYKQAALTTVDPRNGQIKVMVGGTDYGNHQYNRVTQAQRQPGSTFKPFVYATAIAAGFSPYRSFTDAPYVIDGYRPENYGDKYSGGQVSLSKALASSLNVVAVQVLVQVGWNPIIKIAQQMGIESKLKPTYSLALGAWEVNLLELTSAYGTFAHQGIHQKAYGINRILDRQGKVIYQAPFKPEQALDPDTTAIMTWMLRGVVTSGTGTSAQLGERPVAGKTGTSDQARDLWFVGYIPQLVTGVWLGNDNNRPTWGASTTAATIWGEFMGKVVEDMAIESFPELPKLSGRKQTIKAEPIKPKRTYYQAVSPPETSEGSQSGTRERRYSEERRTTRRRRRNRVVSPESQPTAAPPTQQTRQTTPTAAPDPQPPVNSAPAVVEQTESVPIPVPAPIPETAPPAPPAPPAARKTE